MENQHNLTIASEFHILGYISAIELLEIEEGTLLILKNIVDFGGLRSGMEVELLLNLNQKPIQRLCFSITKIIKSKNRKHLSMRIDGWELQFFNPLSWEILLDWDRETRRFIDWRELDEAGKKSWLKACLHWSNLASRLDETEDLIINGEEVEGIASFYCHLGESFIGKRGYFGQDLGGLEDCIRSLANRRFDPQKNTIMVFHREMLQKNLDTEKNLEIYGRPYSEIIWEIFQENGFQLKFMGIENG